MRVAFPCVLSCHQRVDGGIVPCTCVWALLDSLSRAAYVSQAQPAASAQDDAASGSTAGSGVDAFSCNSVISSCEKCQQWERVLQLLGTMPQSSVRPDVITFSAAMSACEKGRQWAEALRLLGQMRSAGLAPNSISYNAGITACEGQLEWRRAADLFAEMGRASLRPSVVTLSALVAVCEKGGQWQQALEVLRDMPRQRVRPGVVAYGAAISACGGAGRWDWSLHLLQELRLEALEPSEVAYGAVLGACAQQEQWAQGLQILHDMRRGHVGPNLVAYSAVLAGSRNAGRGEWLPDLLEAHGRCLASALRQGGPASSAPDVGIEVSAVQTLAEHGWLRCDVLGAFHRSVGIVALASVRGLLQGPAKRHDLGLARQSCLPASSTSLVIHLAGAAPQAQAWSLKARRDSRRTLDILQARPAQDPVANLIAAWTSGVVAVDAGAVAAGGFCRSSHGRVGGLRGHLASERLVPIFVEHDRSAHAERHLLDSWLPHGLPPRLLLRPG